MWQQQFGRALLAQIAQTPGSRFSHWLHERAQPLETLDLALARQLWADMHGAAGVQDLVDLLRQDAQGVSEQDILDWCREHMAVYKCPKSVQFVPALPKSGSGKVMWRLLQEQEKAAAPQ